MSKKLDYIKKVNNVMFVLHELYPFMFESPLDTLFS